MKIYTVFMKSSNKITLINIISLILSQGIIFLTTPIFTRLLGTYNYGKVSVFMAMADIVYVIFSLNTVSSLGVAQNEYLSDEQDKYQSSILTLSSLSFLFFTVIYIIFLNSIANYFGYGKMFAFLIVIYAYSVFLNSFATTRYIYAFRAEINLLISIITTISSVLLSLIFISHLEEMHKFYGRIIAFLIPNLLIGAIVAVNIILLGKTFYNKNYWKFCIYFSLPTIIHTISNMILAQSDRLMIDKMSDSSQTGIYSLAYGFGSIVVIIYDALNKSWIPFYYEYLLEGDENIIKIHTKEYIELYLVIICGFLMVFPEIFHIYASDAFWEGENIIPILIIGFFLMFLYSICINYEFFIKKTKFMAVITASAALLNIFLNYFMIRKWGIIGAAYATTISYLYEFVVHFIYCRFYYRKNFPFDFCFFIKPILIFSVGMIIFRLSCNFNIYRWIIGFGLGCYIIYKINRKKRIF